MALTKADLVKLLTKEEVLTRKKSKRAVDCLIESMKQALVGGQDLLISGFGKFSVSRRGHKRVRNPRTGAEFLMEPRRVVTFKVSPVLRRRVNGNHAEPVVFPKITRAS